MWISLLGTGVLIALLPLLLVWFTKKSDRYQKLAWWAYLKANIALR